ncbi:Gfo/Idh/MocA family protein [Pseudopedobacter beijingensis]|uniref:Gfo/Idh/MocA family protein n=1 Tax=Pseudopedobacter beijingensis TaxID=1207056 RepID=A0ABW4I8K7_9SPHI
MSENKSNEQKDVGDSSTRRNFLKSTAIAAAAFTIVPRHVLGGSGFLAPSDTLYVAGVGGGGKGYSNLKNIRESGKAVISHLCDVDDRRSAKSREENPKAKYYKDWRELLDKEHKKFDAVCVSTPDHNHAVVALAAMQRKKHVFVEKPLTHDIYEARVLRQAAQKYKVVTQMGNQGSSSDGLRKMQEWFEAGALGNVHTVYCWTDRPVWPQGIAWSQQVAQVPKELDWNLWLGTAPMKDYVDKLVPFNWRGWWDYGTGALGDMGCHLLDAPCSVLGLQHATEVEASVGTVYVDEFKRGYFPESCPPSSHVILTFPETEKNKSKLKLHWMDGGIKPERPEEMDANDDFGKGNGILFMGEKGKMFATTYNNNARLLPASRNQEFNVAETKMRVPGGTAGHYQQWVEACIAGFGKKELSSPFETAAQLTETLLMANLAIRAHDVQRLVNGKVTYPGRSIKLLWDNENMRVTNFDEVNQFVKREYREGFKLSV